MPYYIAEIQLNMRSKNKRKERVRKRLFPRLITILLACLLFSIPILIVPAAVGSNQSAVIEALEALGEDISKLPPGAEGFKNPQAAEGKRTALLNKVNAVARQVIAGAYRGAVNKLKNDLNGTISNWVAEEYASSLIEKVENIIKLILKISGPPVHDIAITSVAPSVVEAYIGDPVGIEVAVANEGTESETFDVYVYADRNTVIIGDEITIDILLDVSLEAEATTTLSVTWETTSVAEGTFTISAEVPPVVDEENTDNNSYVDGTVTLSPVLEHDVAVTGISAPTEVIKGVVVTISVEVANPGDSNETFDIVVTYDTISIGTQSVNLASKDSTTISFSWETADVDPGIYTITAEAILPEDEDLTNNEASRTITVTLEPVHLPPVASFTYTPKTPRAGDTVTFDASMSHDPDGTIVSWAWDFGDGTTSAGEIVEHAFAEAGIYTATLIVTDDFGLNDTSTAEVTVSPALRSPVALFSENATTVLTGEVIHFNASESYDPDGIIESYEWDFGDGTTASGVTADHLYDEDGTYTVTLTVKDDDGLTGSDSAVKVVENRGPVAAFTQSVETVDTGETTTFDASESYDPDGNIVSYEWNFGDGAIVTETDPITTHVYEDDGSYSLTLTVTDDDGAQDLTSTTKTVLNREPTASFIQNATAVNLGEAINFNASDSYDPDGSIIKYFWDFGYGTNETGKIVDHAFTEAGNFTVTLTVTDDDGATSSDTVKIMVSALIIPWALYAAVALGLAAAAATVVYLWYRRRRKKKAAIAAVSPPNKPLITFYVPKSMLSFASKPLPRARLLR